MPNTPLGAVSEVNVAPYLLPLDSGTPRDIIVRLTPGYNEVKLQKCSDNSVTVRTVSGAASLSQTFADRSGVRNDFYSAFLALRTFITFIERFHIPLSVRIFCVLKATST